MAEFSSPIEVQRTTEAHRQEVLDRAIAASGFTEAEIREQAAADDLQNFQACFAWALMRDPEPAPDQEASQ